MATIVASIVAGYLLVILPVLWLVMRLGRSAARIEAAQMEIGRQGAALKMVPNLVMRMGAVEDLQKRNTRNIATLLMVAKEEPPQ